MGQKKKKQSVFIVSQYSQLAWVLNRCMNFWKNKNYRQNREVVVTIKNV